MKLPPLTALQFFVVQIAECGSVAGKTIRELLAEAGSPRSLPGFYQLMARMEEAGWVKGHRVTVEVEGYPVIERHYDATPKGRRAAEQTREFYAGNPAALRRS